MKKKYRLHYQLVDGYEPTDGKRNYLCFTIITPNSDKLKTLAVDEDIYNKITRKSSQAEKIILDTLTRQITAGKLDGAIEIMI